MRETSARVEAAFDRIARMRMAGLPFVNSALRVEMVGLRPWDGQRIGVLVTPWAMNLLLLPGEGSWDAMPTGAERFVELPAGRFRFVSAHDDLIGEYHACSLFSPTLEFADHEAAHATAVASLAALFDPATAADGTKATFSRRDFLRGRGTVDADRG